MSLHPLLRTLVHTGLVAAFVLAAAPAWSESPGDANARASFQRFAQSWMGKFKKLEAQNRLKPKVSPTSGGTTTTYRGYGDDFSIELRPTGVAIAPYIGLLRYQELVYSCVADRCSVASTAPVTEIFRFQDGKWMY